MQQRLPSYSKEHTITFFLLKSNFWDKIDFYFRSLEQKKLDYGTA